MPDETVDCDIQLARQTWRRQPHPARKPQRGDSATKAPA